MTHRLFVDFAFSEIDDYLSKTTNFKTANRGVRDLIISKIKGMLVEKAALADREDGKVELKKVETPMSIARPAGKESHEPVVMTPEDSFKGDDVHESLGSEAGKARGVRMSELKLSQKPQT